MKKYFVILILLFSLFGCQKESKTVVPNKEAPIILIDNNELKYYEKVYYKSYGDCTNKKDCAEIKIEYPELIATNPALDSINLYIKNGILNLSFNEDNYSNLDELSDSLFSNFISLQRDFPDYHTGWYLKTKVSILFSKNDILSLRNDTDVFTGGANSNYIIELTNFDLKTGKILLLEDIIENESLAKISDVAENIFKKTNNIKTSYKDNGYWFENDTFQLTDNFTISDSGIVFIYNLYEIAPRSTGITELFIPKESITDFVKIFK